jgi:Lipocalin-like domain
MARHTGPILASALVLGLASPVGEAIAQTARDVVGSWTAVSITAEQGGNRVDLFGPDPRGVLMLGGDGRYALTVLRRGLPAFASNARPTGTPEENKAVVQGSIAHYGTYAIDEANRVMTFRVEASTFPNWDGAEQKRPFTLSGDVLTLVNPASSSGLGANQTVWRRAR